jgi:hypothetical protein
MDNASNNQSFMKCLEAEMIIRDVNFDATDRRIMCFAHIINLCSGRVLQVDGAPDDEHDPTLTDNNSATLTSSSPIALARAVVRAIRGSGSRRAAFDEIIEKGNDKGWFKSVTGRLGLPKLQLLRDVRTRWDSVYKMLSRLREMGPVCDLFNLY